MLPDAPFKITASAKDRILKALEEYRQLKAKSAIPALMWIDASLNNNHFPSHIGIGLYDVRADIVDALYAVDGLELGVAMNDRDFERIKGRTIDFDPEIGLVPV